MVRRGSGVRVPSSALHAHGCQRIGFGWVLSRCDGGGAVERPYEATLLSGRHATPRAAPRHPDHDDHMFPEIHDLLDFKGEVVERLPDFLLEFLGPPGPREDLAQEHRAELEVWADPRSRQDPPGVGVATGDRPETLPKKVHVLPRHQRAVSRLSRT